MFVDFRQNTFDDEVSHLRNIIVAIVFDPLANDRKNALDVIRKLIFDFTLGNIKAAHYSVNKIGADFVENRVCHYNGRLVDNSGEDMAVLFDEFKIRYQILRRD